MFDVVRLRDDTRVNTLITMVTQPKTVRSGGVEEESGPSPKRQLGKHPGQNVKIMMMMDWFSTQSIDLMSEVQ